MYYRTNNNLELLNVNCSSTLRQLNVKSFKFNGLIVVRERNGSGVVGS